MSLTKPAEMHLLKPGMSLCLLTLTTALRSPRNVNVEWAGDKEMGWTRDTISC